MRTNRLIKTTLLLASSLTVMSGALIAPALPRMAEVFAEVPHAGFLTKLILTIPAIFIALLSPVAGWLVDRFGKLRLFSISMLLYAVAGSAGFILSNLYYILISRAILGMAVAGIMTTATTLIGDYFDGEERKKFLGTQAAFMAFGGTVFVSLSGLLADISWRFPFLVYLFSLVVVFLVHKYLFEPSPTKQTFKKGSYTVGNKGLISLIYVATLFGMLMFYMIPVQSPFLMKEIGIESNFLGGLGLVVATFFAAVAGQSYGRLKSKYSFLTLYAFTFGFMALGYGIISIADQYWMVLLGMIFGGFGAGLMMPIANLWLIEIVPPQSRGKVIGGLTSAVFLGQFLSPVVVQPLVELTSLHIAYGIGAGVLLLATTSFAISVMVQRKKRVTATAH